MCFDSPSIPAPVQAPTPEEKQAAVAPAQDAASLKDPTVNAGRLGKSKLRIDLNPVATGATGGNGLSVTG